MINSDVGIISNELQSQLDKAIEVWERTVPRVSQKPRVNEDSETKGPELLPTIRNFGRTKHLEYKGLEDRSPENGWVKNCSSPLPIYELKMVNSPYELHIQAICDHRYCPKIAAIDRLIDQTWDKGEKAVFATMGPTNALILYWVGR